MRDEEPHTSVVVPSLTLDQSELRKLPGASFYEERLLFLLIRLRNPRARMVYVTSQPVHPIVLEYYFQFLAGIPASHARARLTLLCAVRRLAALADREDPRAAAPHRAHPRRHRRPLARLPHRLQLDAARAPAGGAARHPAERRRPEPHPPRHQVGEPQGLPRGRRGPARWASRTCAREHDVEKALAELRAKRPGLRRAVVKLNDSFSGEGNAIFRYPEGDVARRPARRAARRWSSRCPTETPDVYFDKFARMGGIVEEFIEAPEKALALARSCASAPAGEVMPISTHDQILGGPSGQVFLGCSFPADDDYRMRDPGGGDQDRRGARQPRRGEPLRRRLPRARATGPDEAWKIYGARDQPAHGRHDPSLPRAAVPHRRPARSRHRPLPLAHRPREVLPGHRQPALRAATAASCPRT